MRKSCLGVLAALGALPRYLVILLAAGASLGGCKSESNGATSDSSVKYDLAYQPSQDLAGQPGQDLAGADAAHAADLACVADLQTDSANCGRCGHSCLGGACAAGVCQAITLATPPNGSNYLDNIAADETHVYYTSCFGGGGAGSNATSTGIFQLDVNGTAQTPTAVQAWAGSTSPAACPQTLALSGTSIYWNEYPANIWKSALTGGTPTSIYTPPDSKSSMSRLATNLAGAHVFAIVADGDTNMNRIYDCGPTCTSVYSVAYSQTIQKLDADATYVYWIESGAAGGHVYRLAIGATAGTAPTDLSGGQAPTPVSLALDGVGYIYWENNGGTIYRSPVANAAPQMIITGTDSLSFVADANNVYWGEQTSMHIRYAPAAGGGAATDLVASAVDPYQLALDTTALFWVDRSAGTIQKVALP